MYDFLMVAGGFIGGCVFSSLVLRWKMRQFIRKNAIPVFGGPSKYR